MSPLGLLRWLILIALFFAPLAMIGASPAMGHERVTAGGHCDDISKPAEAPPAAPVDCMIACTALPAQTAAAAHPALVPVAPEPRALTALLSGLQPEAATPPPRSS